VTDSTTGRTSAASLLLDVEQVTSLLHSLLPHDWPAPAGDVAIERCWPSADDGFIVEWSFSLGSERRYSLYARSTRGAPTPGEVTSHPHRPARPWHTRVAASGCVRSFDSSCYRPCPCAKFGFVWPLSFCVVRDSWFVIRVR